MKANGITCTDYRPTAGGLELDLACSAEEALSMDTSVVSIETDDGDLVARLVNLVKATATVTAGAEGMVTLRCALATGEMAEAVTALASRLASQGDELAAVSQSADEAMRKAEEAAEGANPQIVSLARMQVATMDFTTAADGDVMAICTLWPEWQVGHVYKQGDPFTYEGRYFRASQAGTSSETYKPGDPGTESLYYEVELAADGIIVWQECKGQYNSVRKGERRHYPDADGPVYESLVDWNAYSPDVRPDDWRLVGDAD